MRTLASEPIAPTLTVLGSGVAAQATGTEADASLRRIPRRVLVVEDESPIRQMLAELLHDAGYGVQHAADGFEALQLLRDGRPDLIVLDLMLPRMSGWQFLERSRSDLDRGNIPVLVVSAIAGQGEDPASLGVAAWLTKPLDIDRFLQTVQSLAGPAHRISPSPGNAVRHAATRLLVIEDDAPIRHLLVEYLRDEGYAVDSAGSIREARERIRTVRPDLLLLDLMLPEESGWEFLRERRRDPGLSELRVIVLSAAPRDLLLEARDLGADAFISKPFELDVVMAMIQSFAS